jgi:hypothetical protein
VQDDDQPHEQNRDYRWRQCVASPVAGGNRERCRLGEQEGGGEGGSAHYGPDGNGVIGWFLGGGAGHGVASRWQVGEEGGQFLPGAGAEGLRGSLVEFFGCDPADPEGFAQLGQRPVAVGVGYPHLAGRKAPVGFVQTWRSFGAESNPPDFRYQLSTPVPVIVSGRRADPGEQAIHDFSAANDYTIQLE